MRFAALVAGSPTAAFYSQVAVLAVAFKKLDWGRWEPSIHLYLGGGGDPRTYAQWLPHLRDVELHVDWESEADDEDWVQSDDVFRNAPDDVEIVVVLDADMLPVAPFVDLLEHVLKSGAVAGVVAHYPIPGDPRAPAERWERAAEGMMEKPLDFSFRYTLLSPLEADRHPAPFYLNFGAVFFTRDAFALIAPRYLEFRPELKTRMDNFDFSGQVALTLAITECGTPTRALPMRFNFPNDPIAEGLYPEELQKVVMFHYLRTTNFDRHLIFATLQAYERFLAIPLEGVDRSFQRAVRDVLGVDYPFS